jgi:hypothetical protein
MTTDKPIQITVTDIPTKGGEEPVPASPEPSLDTDLFPQLKMTVFAWRGHTLPAGLLPNLWSFGYFPFVDALHGHDLPYLKNAFVNCDHMFLRLYNNMSCDWIKAHDITFLERELFSMVLYFDEKEGTVLTDEEWEKVALFIAHVASAPSFKNHRKAMLACRTPSGAMPHLL